MRFVTMVNRLPWFVRLAVLGGTVLCCAGGSASAATIFYTDRAAWEAAANPNTVLDFEDIAPIGGQATFAGGLTLAGVTFVGSTGSTAVADSGIGSFISDWGTGDMLFGFGFSSASIPSSILFSTPVLAFGFDYGATACTFFANCPGNVQLSLSTGASFVSPSVAMPPMGFVGVISDTVITSASLTISPSLGVVDRFAFSRSTSTVPEPSTVSLVLLGASLAGATVSRRRRTARDTRHSIFSR